ncbi:FbpB family small basic protein [Lederbergia citri]|uniref:FbpB family small basic protein n=1 Tax=Lederbergia citri TaxID=2833580 RepID=A0A942TAA8_9BACI|nr:FbpB family small basic protein [Lederbergia citri]MBS4194108.1 FbpB family small basic protein [Lederbergia citri]MBW8348996.1 FbpB family small basic protein [Bacillus sp. IITD106]
MRRRGKKTFLDLVQENKQALLNDSKALETIENRLDEKHMRRA